MKKFLIAALATTSMVSAAQAGSISLDLRADSQSQQFNDEAAKADSHRYYFKIVRLNYEGAVNENLSFRIRGAYNKDATVTTAGENNQAALEYAYINHKMGDFTLQAGRIASDAGGLEGATSGADLYLTSQAYTGNGVTGASGALNNSTTNANTTWLSTAQLLYVNGAKLSYNFMADQSVSVVAFKAPAASTGADNSHVTGLIWKGAFLDKSLKAQVSYHMGNGNVVTADKRELIAAGLAWTFSPITAQVDYVNSSFKEDASGDKDQVTSYVAKFSYTGFEQFIPRLEYIMSENDIAGTGKDKFQGYGAVVEFRPYSDFNNFRYHVAYHNIKQELVAGGDAEVQEFTVGARLLADFLK